MRRLTGALSLCIVLSGCFGGSDPETAPAPEARNRSQCDSFAAQAIQSADLERATTLAAQASQCYAELRSVPRR